MRAEKQAILEVRQLDLGVLDHTSFHIPTRQSMAFHGNLQVAIKEAKTLLEAIALVVLVVFIFLQSWRATLIPILTVPVSLVGAFIFFPAVGFTINSLSLLHAPFVLGLITGGAVIYWFTGASMQAVTTGAYRAVEFIKANIRLEGVEKASVATLPKKSCMCDAPG